MKKTIKWLMQPNYVWMTLMQVLLPLYLYLAIGAEWYWWILAFIFYFLYLCIGNNIGMHRYFCHNYFEMSPTTEKFVVWCGAMACMGSPICYASIHQVHHRHYDTQSDPHGRPRGWKSILYYFHKQIDHRDVKFTRNLADLTKKYGVLHMFYWPFVFANAFLFYLISWKVLLFCWLIPASLTLWAVSLVLLLQHDKNGPSNTKCYQWFGFGEAYHKNHHDDPSLIEHGQGLGVDWTYQISKLLCKSQSK